MGTRLEHCFYCNKKIGISWDERYTALADELPKETHQKLLDGINSGMTIGEAKDFAEIEDTMVACNIINRNIQSFQWVRKEAV